MKSNQNSLDNLYVIAAIFNPASYKSRTDLYYQFEAHMKDSGVNLITIECIYGEDNNEFNVTHKNNPNHIQLKTNHPLWHKENLINIAIRKLPNNWRYVLWLDADIEFLEKNWTSKIIEAFESYDIIQVFKYAHFLGPNKETLDTHFSFTYSIVEELPISKKHYSLFYPHPGYGWGISRIAYEHINGLLDWSVLGSGDSHMAFSMIGRYSESMGFPKTVYTENYWKMLEKWQENVKLFSDNKRVGYADCVIQHHFHGYREDRQYINRMKILIENKYDPTNDILITENGLYQFKENKKTLIEQIYFYFNSRKEDTKQSELVKATPSIQLRTPEEILNDANYVKKLIAIEKFKKIERKFSTKNNENQKRSKSMNQNKRKKKPKKTKLKPKKILVIEISSDVNDFFSDSDSESSNFTDESDSSKLSDFISVEGLDSPNRSRKGSVSDELMMQCGICSSKKSVEEKNENKSGKEASKGNNKNYHNNNVVIKADKSKNTHNVNLNNNNPNPKNINPAPGLNNNHHITKKKKKKDKKPKEIKLKIHHEGHSNNSSENESDSDNNFDQNNYY